MVVLVVVEQQKVVQPLLVHRLLQETGFHLGHNIIYDMVVYLAQVLLLGSSHSVCWEEFVVCADLSVVSLCFLQCLCLCGLELAQSRGTVPFVWCVILLQGAGCCHGARAKPAIKSSSANILLQQQTTEDANQILSKLLIA